MGSIILHSVLANGINGGKTSSFFLFFMNIKEIAVLIIKQDIQSQKKHSSTCEWTVEKE